ncbi:hypothetical protein B5S33_g3883 [[Candida] boidinii]|nr:hypothetical protein B5S30_g3511 [[Candida] boidinii]OWB85223.1 hypothetical protein B5S33_g3883 [[Candida] boidinii]
MSELMDTDLISTSNNGKFSFMIPYLFNHLILTWESTEDDILDVFEEFGSISNIHLNLDRQSGYVKGYALLEFNSLENAINAIKNLDNTELLGQTIFVDFAFTENKKTESGNHGGSSNRDDRDYRIRDKSPIR